MLDKTGKKTHPTHNNLRVYHGKNTVQGEQHMAIFDDPRAGV